MEKYVGERIGGYLGVPRDGSQRRTSIERVAPTHPEKGVRAGGREGGPCMRDRQTKTIVQVCRDTNQEEKASRLSKTG